MKNIMLVVVMLLPTAGFSADSEGGFNILGAGTAGCGSVVEAHQEDQQGDFSISYFQNMAWVNGYLTAIDQYVYSGSSVTHGTDVKSRQLWIYNYCQQNPLDSLYDAANALIGELLIRDLIK